VQAQSHRPSHSCSPQTGSIGKLALVRDRPGSCVAIFFFCFCCGWRWPSPGRLLINWHPVGQHINMGHPHFPRAASLAFARRPQPVSVLAFSYYFFCPRLPGAGPRVQLTAHPSPSLALILSLSAIKHTCLPADGSSRLQPKPREM
jgi:hypothetical protein